jgi:hypothetical protein
MLDIFGFLKIIGIGVILILSLAGALVLAMVWFLNHPVD